MSGQAHHHYTGDIGGCYYPDIWGLHGIAVNHYKDQLSNNQAHHLFFVFYLGGGLKMFPKQKPEHSKPTLRGRTQHGSLLCQCLDSNRGSRFRNGGPQWEALMVPFKFKLVDADVWCFFLGISKSKEMFGTCLKWGKKICRTAVCSQQHAPFLLWPLLGARNMLASAIPCGSFPEANQSAKLNRNNYTPED